MQPSLAMISYTAKDSFDFNNRLDKHCPTGTTLSTCDNKSLYTNIRHGLFHTAVGKLQSDLKLLQRFNNQFILEVLSIALEFKYINVIYINHIKGTAMGTKLAVVSSNLVVAFDEVKMFALLSQLCPQDFVESFIRN